MKTRRLAGELWEARRTLRLTLWQGLAQDVERLADGSAALVAGDPFIVGFCHQEVTPAPDPAYPRPESERLSIAALNAVTVALSPVTT